MGLLKRIGKVTKGIDRVVDKGMDNKIGKGLKWYFSDRGILDHFRYESRFYREFMENMFFYRIRNWELKTGGILYYGSGVVIPNLTSAMFATLAVAQRDPDLLYGALFGEIIRNGAWGSFKIRSFRDRAKRLEFMKESHMEEVENSQRTRNYADDDWDK
jgi:hypothetical protein